MKNETHLAHPNMKASYQSPQTHIVPLHGEAALLLASLPISSTTVTKQLSSERTSFEDEEEEGS